MSHVAGATGRGSLYCSRAEAATARAGCSASPPGRAKEENQGRAAKAKADAAGLLLNHSSVQPDMCVPYLPYLACTAHRYKEEACAHVHIMSCMALPLQGAHHTLTALLHNLNSLSSNLLSWVMECE